MPSIIKDMLLKLNVHCLREKELEKNNPSLSAEHTWLLLLPSRIEVNTRSIQMYVHLSNFLLSPLFELILNMVMIFVAVLKLLGEQSEFVIFYRVQCFSLCVVMLI